jgi:hypothetical protein
VVGARRVAHNRPGSRLDADKLDAHAHQLDADGHEFDADGHRIVTRSFRAVAAGAAGLHSSD